LQKNKTTQIKNWQIAFKYNVTSGMARINYKIAYVHRPGSHTSYERISSRIQNTTHKPTLLAKTSHIMANKGLCIVIQ